MARRYQARALGRRPGAWPAAPPQGLGPGEPRAAVVGVGGDEPRRPGPDLLGVPDPQPALAPEERDLVPGRSHLGERPESGVGVVAAELKRGDVGELAEGP